MLDPDSRTWSVDAEMVRDLEGDLQVVVNCTRAGDILLIDPSVSIRPRGRITVPRAVTISAIVDDADLDDGVFPRAQRKLSFTCPRDNEGVFLVR